VPDETAKRQPALWWTLTIVVALGLFIIALSDEVYNLTSPPGPLRILIRKTYSIVAFALVGYLLSRALGASGRPASALTVAGMVGIYSLAIEIGQDIGGSQEGLALNAIDVACGIIGGYLGRVVSARLKDR
jgi:hypothetical protein